MQNACIHPQHGAEGTAVRSSTFLLTNASQATNTVLEAQSYSTCSQSTMPAQPSTLKSTCKAKLVSGALHLMLSCRDRAAGVTPTKGKAIPGTGKGSPLLLPQQRLQALSWASPFQHSVVQERREKWSLASFQRGRDISF